MNAFAPDPVTQVFGQTQAVSPITPDELDTLIQNRPTPWNEYWETTVHDSAVATLPGSIYRNFEVPDDDRTPVTTPGAGRSGVTVYQPTGVPVMSEEDYKASPYYRPEIPFDGRMTEARAKAKAEIHDANQYRAWLRQNRANGIGTTAMAISGGIIGSAIDPVNYIPIFGPAFKAANASRLAVMMARAGLGAVDAGIATAVEEPIIASSRRQFGEDTSFADQLLDIAMGAAVGGFAGGLHGSLERIGRVGDFHPETVAGRLQTVGEAADAIANDRPIDIAPTYRQSLLSGTALGRAADLVPGQEFRAGDVAPVGARAIDTIVTPEDRAVADWQGRVESVAREAEPAAWTQRDTLLDQQDTLRQQLEAAAPNGTVGDLDAKINYARGQYFAAAFKDKPRYQRALNALYAERSQESLGRLLSQDTPQQTEIRQQLQAVDEKLRDIAPTISASLRQGEAVHARPELPADQAASSAAESPAAFNSAAVATGDSRNLSPLPDGTQVFERESQASSFPPPSGKRTALKIVPSQERGEVKSDIDGSSTSKIYQRSNDASALQARAHELQAPLNDWLQDVVKDTPGAEVSGTRAKASQALEGKLKAKAPNQIGDYLGGRVVVDSWQALRDVVANLRRRADVTEVDDFTDKGKGPGYRAAHVQVRTRDGFSFEVQIQPREIREVQGAAHKIYEKWRRKDPLTFTPEQWKAFTADDGKSRKLFTDAWRGWTSRVGEAPRDISRFDQAMADTANLPRTRTAPRSLDTIATEKPGTPPAALDTAGAAVGKPQTMATDAGTREIAAEHGINPETGDFEEMGEIQRLTTAEQLTADETKALKDSDATIKRADDYAKAYQAAATCLGRD